MQDNLVSFPKIMEIINKVDTADIVQYEGSIGTRASIVGTPYQVIELTLVYTEKESEDEEEKNKNVNG